MKTTKTFGKIELNKNEIIKQLYERTDSIRDEE